MNYIRIKNFIGFSQIGRHLDCLVMTRQKLDSSLIKKKEQGVEEVETSLIQKTKQSADVVDEKVFEVADQKPEQEEAKE